MLIARVCLLCSVVCALFCVEKVQGPFAEGLMRNWFTKGFFQKTIKVRKVGETEFKTIKEYQPDFAEDLGEPEKEPEERGEEMPTPKEPEEAAEPGKNKMKKLFFPKLFFQKAKRNLSGCISITMGRFKGRFQMYGADFSLKTNKKCF